MKKTGLLRKSLTVATALASFALLPNQTKANNLNSENTRTIGEANKSALEETKKKGGEQVAEVDDMTGGLKFNHPRMHSHTSPMYFPKYHPKMTWNQQRQKAKQRKKSKA